MRSFMARLLKSTTVFLPAHLSDHLCEGCRVLEQLSLGLGSSPFVKAWQIWMLGLIVLENLSKWSAGDGQRYTCRSYIKMK